MPKVAMKDSGPVKPKKPSRIRKWLLRLGLGVVGLVLLFVLLLAGSIWVDGLIGKDATDFTNVTFEGEDGAELHAYFVEPENVDGSTPAVVMFHEWWGLNEDITVLADGLASEGYIVLAPDALSLIHI